MKKITILTLLIISLISAVYSGNENNTLGGKANAMGGTSVCISDFWAINNNQAGIAGIKKIQAGFYFDNRFLTDALSYKAIAVVIPTKSGVFGVNYSYFGYNLYNEQKVGFAYARSFGKKLTAGLQFDYLGTSIADNYGNKSAFTFEAGIQAKLTNNLVLGVHFFNPVNASFNDYNNEKIPSVLKLGLSYVLSEKLLIAIETEDNINYDPAFKAGFEYKILSFAYARVGISTNPIIDTFGFGIDYKQFTFDFSSTVHQSLGYSPQFSLIYSFK